ncbi:Hypothetical predicted protein [Marmota monax]|uniref:Reverse transcriptase domain-containing protein n=1 Tax=Marmota monax TaxID=9995 RepID=A0A5E4BW58_MARMO|nr:Hypothetical predicted protein [Marmota monax]
MVIMGPAQSGIPQLSALPKTWYVLVIDIKDCFFSIPIHPEDSPRFAFTIPALNHEGPDQRYEWKVLPQGMANSPTMCQIYVNKVIQPLRNQNPELQIFHYMDDVLLAHKDKNTLLECYATLTNLLKNYNLEIAIDKVQLNFPINYLGVLLSSTMVRPPKIQIRVDQLKSLNDFQKLLGDINWIRPYLGIPTGELGPLFDILKGPSDPNSPRMLTPEARKALKIIETYMENMHLDRIDISLPLLFIVLPTKNIPTGVFWQEGPLLWIHLSYSPNTILTRYPEAVGQLILKGIKAAKGVFGISPNKIITPYTMNQIDELANELNTWAIIMCKSNVSFDNHLPSNPLLSFWSLHPVIFPKMTRKTPIMNTPNIFTDGSNNGTAAIVTPDQTFTFLVPKQSAQKVELNAVLQAFVMFKDSVFNLFSDSQYIVNAIVSLEDAGRISPSSTVFSLLSTIQSLIWDRKDPIAMVPT